MERKVEMKTREEYDNVSDSKKILTKNTADDLETKRLEAKRLEAILDIRKFEIDLYWKRATYFWTFIAVVLASYGLTITAKEANQENIIKFQFIIICFGLVFSFAWYLVNKGSKFWQENWEKHLDLVEDNVIGPLYKTTISKKLILHFVFLLSHMQYLSQK